MASPIRWLHLSDFHVGKDDYAGQKMFDYIIAHVKQRKEEGFAPDLLFITGDLAHKGLKSEYEDLWLEFVLPLQELIGNNIAERTFVVPGNHDVDRDHNQAFGREEMLSDSSRYFDPTDSGLRSRQMLLPRFQAFTDSDLTPCKGAFINAAGAFSTVLTLDGTKVGIAGINTAWLCKGHNDERMLTPGKGMVEQALNSLKVAQLRIVVGHHPLDWLLPAEQKPIKSLFGQNAVIYLHGHLHEEWVEPTYGGGHQFLAIQSGPAFQAREREKLRNGLVWGEADLDAGELRLQSRRWIPNQQAWVPVPEAFHENHRRGDWWHYPLPGSGLAKNLVKRSPNAAAPVPKGWAISSPSELVRNFKPLEECAAVRFFNGAAPSWETALSSSIPRRKIVAALTASFRDAEAAARSHVTVLLAAGCEGKTTALLQAAYQLVADKPDWRVLCRLDAAEPLQLEVILPQLTMDNHWLLVIDEADTAANAIFQVLAIMPRALRGKIHFLLACRDSDWLGANVDKLNWAHICNFHKERLSGLDEADAAAIVGAWTLFGKAGLAEMADVEESERIGLLVQKAYQEAKANTGALFGALLSVRHGKALHIHARLMLDRLNRRACPGGLTLRHALAYIAVMHSEGLEILSRPVLAEVLGCPSDQLFKAVLGPLGEEAAATSTSSFIFTRHRTVATAILNVLEGDFGIDIWKLFTEVAVAASAAADKGIFVPPNLAGWRIGLTDHFVNTGRSDLAIHIAENVFSNFPSISQLFNVARLYRQARHGHKSCSLFRNYCLGYDIKDRKFWREWAFAEHVASDPAASAILASFSISDSCSNRRVDASLAVLALLKLAQVYHDLSGLFRDVVFENAKMASAWMGLHIARETSLREEFHRVCKEGAEFSVDTCCQMLADGVVLVRSCVEENRFDEEPAIPKEMTFNGLSQLIVSAKERVN